MLFNTRTIIAMLFLHAYFTRVSECKNTNNFRYDKIMFRAGENNVINGRCRDRARQDVGMGLMNVKGKVWTADNGRPWGMVVG